jgi:hypothetical protein
MISETMLPGAAAANDINSTRASCVSRGKRRCRGLTAERGELAGCTGYFQSLPEITTTSRAVVDLTTHHEAVVTTSW